MNIAARIVTSTSKYEHITPVLADLHWLPVAARIDFKIAVLTLKAPATNRPSYLHELLHPHKPPRTLRSSSRNLLSLPRSCTTFARRSFACVAPRVWNSLPGTITDNLNITVPTFKSKLKTHLYACCYLGL